LERYTDKEQIADAAGTQGNKGPKASSPDAKTKDQNLNKGSDNGSRISEESVEEKRTTRSAAPHLDFAPEEIEGPFPPFR
jgi:hypothetical protein